MTSDITAPAAGGVDGAAGLLFAEGLVGEEVGGCPDCPLTACEQPATSTKPVTSAAIRISLGYPSHCGFGRYARPTSVVSATVGLCMSALSAPRRSPALLKASPATA